MLLSSFNSPLFVWKIFSSTNLNLNHLLERPTVQLKPSMTVGVDVDRQKTIDRRAIHEKDIMNTSKDEEKP